MASHKDYKKPQTVGIIEIIMFEYITEGTTH